MAGYRFLPATPATADDLERFSRAHGKFRHCSCMRWRATSSDFGKLGKDGRIAALDNLARGGGPVGMLAFCGDHVVGWCSIAPRDTYAALEHSWVLPRVDERPVWSVVCFFIDLSTAELG